MGHLTMRHALPQVRDVLAQAALLLDLDGTLLDIAPRPDAVVVPEALQGCLAVLHVRLGGALALVTGRRLDDVDRLLAPPRLPAAAEHGGVLRAAPAAPPEHPPRPTLPDAWRARAKAFAEARPGLLVEPKSAGFVLHYRAAPEHGPAARAFLGELAAAGLGFELLRADMAWELRPAGVDKGRAVRTLMARAPFAGRRPIFIGDDVTDEDGIAAAKALGGLGLRVAEAFGGPAEVRAWLAMLCEGHHAAAP
jgi:trehalose 6-phosphate phosphatase